MPVFNLPYDTRFITDSPYTSYHRFGSDPLFNRDVENVNEMEHWGVSMHGRMAGVETMCTSSRSRRIASSRTRSAATPTARRCPSITPGIRASTSRLTQEFQITGLAADEQVRLGDRASSTTSADDSNQGWNFLYPFILSTNNHKDVQDDRELGGVRARDVRHQRRAEPHGRVRYTDDQKDVNVFRQDFRTGAVIIPNTAVSVDAQETSPKIGLNWQLRDELDDLRAVGHGFRGGGFGPRPANPLQVAAFDVEEVETLEGGVKTDLQRRPVAREQRDLFQRSDEPAAGYAGIRFVGRDLV